MSQPPRDPELESLLADIVAHHDAHGELPNIAEVARNHPELSQELAALAYRYLAIDGALDSGIFDAEASTVTRLATEPPLPARTTGDPDEPLPVIEGFRTIERLGAGGMGEVYKLHDPQLNRLVAAKLIRQRNHAGGAPGFQDRKTRLRDFMREARSLALFSDPRIVTIYECRFETEPAVIIMEHVDGFELGRIGPSLEITQRAKVMRDICLALHHAHSLGIQHRDLKPSNIMLDGKLRPKILDFGLSDSDPAAGHFRGTVQYIAPEQLDPAQPIDARTDVYALGVMLYELLCGATPFHGRTSDVLEAVKSGQPRLPREVDPHVPEPLQAIALKAMERRPGDRYASAEDMARDLERYIANRPVLARPTQYATTLGTRIRPHIDQIAEWLRLKLIYPHEAARLTSAYHALEAREDDWIVASRELSYAQIALYLGAFFLFAGSLFYFYAHRVENAAPGMIGPVLILGLPFLGLNAAGRWLYQRERQAVAVAFFLGGLTLLPLFLLIWFHDWGFWNAREGDAPQLFEGDFVSNRQLQVTVAIAAAWASWLAFRTRTTSLSAAATILFFLLGIAVLAEFGLRTWFDNSRFDLLALHLAPLVALYAAAGLALERTAKYWFARPAYVAGATTLVVALDLFAIDGKLLHYVGLTMGMLQPPDIENPVLIDMLAGLSLNGVLFYLVGSAIERRGTPLMGFASFLLFTIAPFSMLEPLAYLSDTGNYHQGFDWLYLGLAIAIAILSHDRQRKSFYYAGLLNAGIALVLIADHRHWLNRPSWAVTTVIVGLTVLGIGFALDTQRRRQG